MADRKVFAAALITAVLVLAGAFALPQFFFFFELAKSSIFVAIAALAYYAEERYAYMLGMVAPPVWLFADWMEGTLGNDFRVLAHYVVGKNIAPLETPLFALAHLAAIALFVVSVIAWRREVPEKMFGKTFWRGLIVTLAYVGTLAVWLFTAFPAGPRVP